ncbi:MAG: Na/Pi cotransporter family protein, partial [Lachnospiraceae bacterium]
MLENITNLFMFIGGIGMFLYGMHLMADGMQKTAGNRMKDFLGMLTSNRFTAALVGAAITAIIQSSGATTVMVVGFVSAGLMTLGQAVGVIMGANVGTTVTAWIVSLSQLGDSLKVLNPEFYAPLLTGIGAGIMMFAKSPKKKVGAEIIIGIGLLFQGLSFMSDAISLYTDAPIFAEVFTALGYNPILGILSGALITGLLQSSSVSIGILQTLAMNGLVTANAAVFITLGGNIGSCVTGMMSAVGSSRTAKRAAVMNLSFNVIGAVLFGVGGTLLFTALPQIAHHSITPVQISLFHTFFNCIM